MRIDVENPTNHANLPGLAWTSSGHTGTASTLAGFSGTGAAAEYTESNYTLVDGTRAFTGAQTFVNSGIHMLDTNASHDLILAVGSDLTADRTLTLTTGDSDRTITLNGNPTLDDWFDQNVKSGQAPTFTADNFSDGGSNAIITTTQETNFETAYSHSQDNSQAHSDYLINNGDDTTSGSLSIGGQLAITGASRVRVTKNDAQAITDSTPTKIQYDDEVFDNLSEYDNSSNYRFTATEAGYYHVNAGFLTANSAWTAGDIVYLHIYKNGADYVTPWREQMDSTVTKYAHAGGSTLVYLTAGEYIEIYGRINRGANTNLHSDPSYNYFEVHRLS